MTVTVYVAGKVVGEAHLFDDTEVLAAAGSVMTEEKLGRCAIRFEDEQASYIPGQPP